MLSHTEKVLCPPFSREKESLILLTSWMVSSSLQVFSHIYDDSKIHMACRLQVEHSCIWERSLNKSHELPPYSFSMIPIGRLLFLLLLIYSLLPALSNSIYCAHLHAVNPKPSSLSLKAHVYTCTNHISCISHLKVSGNLEFIVYKTDLVIFLRSTFL